MRVPILRGSSAVFGAGSDTDPNRYDTIVSALRRSWQRSMQSTALKAAAFPIAVKAVMIDLERYAAGSRAGYCRAANRTLAELQLPVIAEEELKTYIGNCGIAADQALLMRDMDAEPDAGFLAQRLAIFEKHYADVVSCSRPYPGVIDGLDALRQAGYRLACITNKAKVHPASAAGYRPA